MTTLSRGACALSILGFALALAGCGGGGSGVSTPTGTGTPSPTGIPGSSQPITAGQFVFVSNRTGAEELFRADLNGSNVVQLSQLARQGIMNIERPSVSPDGKRIAFEYGFPSGTTGTDNLEIALINTNGTGLIKLTGDTASSHRPDDYNPVFSPDNRYIYWISKRASAGAPLLPQIPHIWRMDAAVGQEGQNQVQFTTAQASYLSLDRTGNALAYVASDQTSSPIAIQSLSNNTLTGAPRLIGGAVNGSAVFGLALSPDASRVAFSVGVSAAGSGTGTTSLQSARLNVLSVASGASAGTAPTGGTVDTNAAWSRDSQTLFFDSAGGSVAGRQVFSSTFPFSTKTQLTTGDANSINYSSAFLTGG